MRGCCVWQHQRLREKGAIYNNEWEDRGTGPGRRVAVAEYGPCCMFASVMAVPRQAAVFERDRRHGWGSGMHARSAGTGWPGTVAGSRGIRALDGHLHAEGAAGRHEITPFDEQRFSLDWSTPSGPTTSALVHEPHKALSRNVLRGRRRPSWLLAGRCRRRTHADCRRVVLVLDQVPGRQHVWRSFP